MADLRDEMKAAISEFRNRADWLHAESLERGGSGHMDAREKECRRVIQRLDLVLSAVEAQGWRPTRQVLAEAIHPSAFRDWGSEGLSQQVAQQNALAAADRVLALPQPPQEEKR